MGNEAVAVVREAYDIGCTPLEFLFYTENVLIGNISRSGRGGGRLLPVAFLGRGGRRRPVPGTALKRDCTLNSDLLLR